MVFPALLLVLENFAPSVFERTSFYAAVHDEFVHLGFLGVLYPAFVGENILADEFPIVSIAHEFCRYFAYDANV